MVRHSSYYWEEKNICLSQATPVLALDVFCASIHLDFTAMLQFGQFLFHLNLWAFFQGAQFQMSEQFPTISQDEWYNQNSRCLKMIWKWWIWAFYPSPQMPYTLDSAFQGLSQSHHLHAAFLDPWLTSREFTSGAPQGPVCAAPAFCSLLSHCYL